MRNDQLLGMKDSRDVRTESLSHGKLCSEKQNDNQRRRGAHVADGITSTDAVEPAADNLRECRSERHSRRQADAHRPHEPVQHGNADFRALGASERLADKMQSGMSEAEVNSR